MENAAAVTYNRWLIVFHHLLFRCRHQRVHCNKARGASRFGRRRRCMPRKVLCLSSRSRRHEK